MRLLDADITELEFRMALQALCTQSARRQDRIESAMPRNQDDQSITHITKYFIHCCKEGSLPQSWRHAKIIFIPKTNKPLTTSNLRLISHASGNYSSIRVFHVRHQRQNALPAGEKKQNGQTVTGKYANAMRVSNSVAAATARPTFFRFISFETRAPNLRQTVPKATPRAFVWFAAHPESSEETRASLSPRFPPCATEPSDESYVAPSGQ
ncbi:hypothetical protein HPB50_018756 [Hyalomma asiaticum]|uniref:Uncharacterized protein n=1 Tax=Hyalomma asiaticum TaxID=266040 RepID=A0ACB7S1U9_HYAAI|nr:hypothetical protein HPB50_018756 [Hyalomma asiaticum]